MCVLIGVTALIELVMVSKSIMLREREGERDDDLTTHIPRSCGGLRDELLAYPDGGNLPQSLSLIGKTLELLNLPMLTTI